MLVLPELCDYENIFSQSMSQMFYSEEHTSPVMSIKKQKRDENSRYDRAELLTFT